MKILSQSFFIKIVAILLFILLLLAGTNMFQTRLVMEKLFTEQQEKRGLSIANMLATQASNLILINNYYDLHELVKNTQQSNDDVRYAFVVGVNGELLAHSFQNHFPAELLSANIPEVPSHYQVTELSTEEGVIRDIVVPIFEGRLGTVHIGLSNKSLQAVLNSTTKKMLFYTLAAVLVGIMLTMYLTNRLTKPIRELVRVTSAITAGDFTQRAVVHSGDELGKLGLAFNSMTESLQKLVAELNQKEEAMVHLLQKVIVAQEEERKRIARELHDETGQTLTSLMMGLKCLADNCTGNSSECQIEDMRRVVKDTLGRIHSLAVELRPSILDDMGLIAALEKYIADYRQTHQIDIDFHVVQEISERILREIEIPVYRIVQEALTNIAKYSQAQNVSVIITRKSNVLELIIEDDGIGFEVDVLMNGNASNNKLGLYGMRERAILVGGTFTIESSPGLGTTIYVRIPLVER
ncbi:HAMP domain-containing protein [Pelosinus sp. IPA-1]|uniref:HAMP domain-containing sensor histidine kinase n=1 Tax=Pelosinus sp. IPA-1 TaxID=3029569 RepID=UPI00243617CF|nr:HAMP domain-containing protein [Pelosinus sp. IPA-1]GMB02247.1 sensor histidine kinase [Pelosinus sp. IPA-1]